MSPQASRGIVLPETAMDEETRIVHALQRLGFGPGPGDRDRVRGMGLEAYIWMQLHPERIPDGDTFERLDALKTLSLSTPELMVAYPPPPLLRVIDRRFGNSMDTSARGVFGSDREKDDDPRERRRRMGRSSPRSIIQELSLAKVVRATYSERQLLEVMTDFWFNHFNVFVGKKTEAWLVGSYERDAIRPHALGRFRDLLGASARHPAMLLYLDNWLSTDPDARIDRRRLQGIYAAEVRRQRMGPLGVVEEILEERGVEPSQASSRMRMPGLGGVGQRSGINENYARELLELHTVGVDGGYTQEDIIHVARCFTGWTVLPIQYGYPFLYVDDFHVRGRKTVLGQRIDGKGMAEGEAVLDLLSRHPSTARFVSFKLAQRFVQDDPPADLVDRMGTTFLESDGDIRAVLTTLFTSKEFWDPAALDAKVKTPLEFVVSAARASGAELSIAPPVRHSSPGLLEVLHAMGQPLYGAAPPTGYSQTADAWISAGMLLTRMKVALGVAHHRIDGVRVTPAPALLEDGTLPELVTRMSEEILGRAPSETTLGSLEDVPGLQPKSPEIRARMALGWFLAVPEFQRR
jgi:uncharacterized protein (DUF1800 family)